MGGGEDADDEKKKTLAGASEAGLDKYLQKRRGGKPKANKKQTEEAKKILAASRAQNVQNDALCGAPAQFQEIPDHSLQKQGHEGRSRVEDAPITAPFWPVRRGSEEDLENWEDDWEEASDLEEIEDLTEDIPAQEEAEKNLLISLGQEDLVILGVDAKTLRQPRKKFSRLEIEAAALSHQFHLLCLLARGQIFDKAADNPLLQAVVMSFVPENVVQNLPSNRGTDLKSHKLKAIADWFKENLRLEDRKSDIIDLENDTQEDRNSGVENMVQRLQEVVSKKEGTPEELIAVFVAALRAHGLLVRFVRALDPLPWRPTLRERFVPRKSRPQNASRKRKADHKEGGEKEGQETPKSVKKGRKNEAKTAKKKSVRKDEEELEWTDSASENKEEVEWEEEEKGQGRSRGRGRGRGGRGRKKQAKSSEKEKKNESQSGRGRGRKKTGKGKKAAEADENKEISDLEIFDNEKIEALDVQENDESKSKRRRKGDVEFENQIAMAMMASANPNPSRSKEDDVINELQPANGLKNPKAFVRKLWREHEANKGSMGATWARCSQNQVGDSWAEVYCDAEDDGRGKWVHVQPQLGLIDRPDRVEGDSVRFGPLSYVTAFSGGGVKDVTSRYVSNVPQMEKIRAPNLKWWERTLRPLRRNEVKATKEYLSSSANPNAEIQGSSQAVLKEEILDLTEDNKDYYGKAGNSLQNIEEDPKPKSKGQMLREALEDMMKSERDSAHAKKSQKRKAKEEVNARASREDAVMQKIAEKHQQLVPTTIEGFKKHKLYILEKHISRYCALRPDAPTLGFFKGEKYFSREDVSDLHTAEKWITHGLEVLPSQLLNPHKTVAKRGTKTKAKKEATKDAGDFEEEENNGRHPVELDDDSTKIKLYGKWQTKPWTPPVAQDGIVPKNERGNVHCPPLAPCLPVGTRQIRRAKIVPVCKRLEVDYAMAMTGFDIHGGRSVPRFEGVVVCEEFAEMVESEWLEEQRALEEKKAQKRMEEASKTWSNLLKAIFLRLGFQELQEQEDKKQAITKKKKGKPAQDKEVEKKPAKTSRSRRKPADEKRIAEKGPSANDDSGEARDNAEIEEI